MVDVNKYLGEKPGFWRRGLSILVMNKDPLDAYQARADRYNEINLEDQAATRREANRQDFELKKLKIDDDYRRGIISEETKNARELENLRNFNAINEHMFSNNSRVMGDKGLLTNPNSLAVYGKAQEPYVKSTAETGLQSGIDKNILESATSRLGTSKANVDNAIVNKPLFATNREAGMNATEMAPVDQHLSSEAETWRLNHMPIVSATDAGLRGWVRDPNDPTGMGIINIPSQKLSPVEEKKQLLNSMGVTFDGVKNNTLASPLLQQQMQQNTTNKPILNLGARPRKFDAQGNPLTY